MAGRPPFEPTEQDRRLVTTMIAGGIELRHILPCLSGPISINTFRKHFEVEIATAKARADAAVVASLHRHAIGMGQSAVSAAKWWTQSRMGWREPPTRIAGADDGPVTISYVVRAPTPVESVDEWLLTYAPTTDDKS